LDLFELTILNGAFKICDKTFLIAGKTSKPYDPERIPYFPDTQFNI